jgi:hypothetical protein
MIAPVAALYLFRVREVQMTERSTLRALVERLHRALDTADLEEVDRVVAPDFIDAHPLEGFGAGREELKRGMLPLADDHLRAEAFDWDEADGRVSCTVVISTTDGHLIYPKGTPISVTRSTWTVHDGKIVRRAGRSDYLVPTRIIDLWTYMIATVERDISGFRAFLNENPDEPGPATTRDELGNDLQVLGRQGWEVAGVVPFKTGLADGRDGLILKRRLGVARELVDPLESNLQPRESRQKEEPLPEGPTDEDSPRPPRARRRRSPKA